MDEAVQWWDRLTNGFVLNWVEDRGGDTAYLNILSELLSFFLSNFKKFCLNSYNRKFINKIKI